MSVCLFCTVASGVTPARVLHEDDLVLAVDIPKDHPSKKAPVHFVVIPREHVAGVRDLNGSHGPMLAAMTEAAGRIATRLGIAESGYRLATNTGPNANQTEFHMHLHCLGGRALGAEG
jgi:histidine triad (HIT) family protein